MKNLLNILFYEATFYCMENNSFIILHWSCLENIPENHLIRSFSINKSLDVQKKLSMLETQVVPAISARSKNVSRKCFSRVHKFFRRYQMPPQSRDLAPNDYFLLWIHQTVHLQS